MRPLLWACAAFLFSACGGDAYPDVASLAPLTDAPDPLRLRSGETVTDFADFTARRRGELIDELEHYVYGHAPPAQPVTIELEASADDVEGGRYEERALRFASSGAAIHLALFRPNGAGPFPVVLVLNQCGNETLTLDERVRVSTSLRIPECMGGARGFLAASFPIARILERGYAIASFHESDVEFDEPSDRAAAAGLRAALSLPAGNDIAPTTGWGVIAAWSYGLQRSVDALLVIPELDAQRIIVTGHSRRGKAALWAGALDPRIATVAPMQSGTAGVKISRSLDGEPLATMTLVYPHWFDGVFPTFAANEDRLPIDQNEVASLVAPRNLMALDGDTDAWADPAGARRSLEAADAVWKLAGSTGLAAQPDGTLAFDAPLTQRVRTGGHALLASDWEILLDYADLRR